MQPMGFRVITNDTSYEVSPKGVPISGLRLIVSPPQVDPPVFPEDPVVSVEPIPQASIEPSIIYSVRAAPYEFKKHLLPALLCRDDLPVSGAFVELLNKLTDRPERWLNGILVHPHHMEVFRLATRTGLKFVDATMAPVLGALMVKPQRGDATRGMRPAYPVEVFPDRGDVIVLVKNQSDLQFAARLRLMWWSLNDQGLIEDGQVQFHGTDGLLAHAAEAVVLGAARRPTFMALYEVPATP